MKYMLLVYSPEDAWTPEEWTACTVESGAVCRELQSQGRLRCATPLHPVATATSVRVRSGQTFVTAGPFAETTEQLGGFFLIDVPSLDDALAIATRLPGAKKGTVEIRPVITLETLPPENFSATPVTKDGTYSLYVLLSYDNEQAWTEAGPAALRDAQLEGVALTHQLNARGQYLSAAPLHLVSAATSVRIRDGKNLVTDGPFAETKEFLGGYYLIYARDLNEVISVAAQHPGVHVGTVEIRQPFEQLMITAG